MTCLIDRENGIRADNWTISLSKAIPQAAMSTSRASLTDTVPTPRTPKACHLPLTSGLYPFYFAIPPPFSFWIFLRVFDGARFVVHTKNPEACRLPVRPFQTSAKLFPLEDSLSGPMTLLASIPPAVQKFYPTMEGQVQHKYHPSNRLFFTDTNLHLFSRNPTAIFSSTQTNPHKFKGATPSVGSLPLLPHPSRHSFFPDLFG